MLPVSVRLGRYRTDYVGLGLVRYVVSSLTRRLSRLIGLSPGEVLFACYAQYYHTPIKGDMGKIRDDLEEVLEGHRRHGWRPLSGNGTAAIQKTYRSQYRLGYRYNRARCRQRGHGQVADRGLCYST